MYAIYGNIYHQYTPNVSIYIPYMDPMGMVSSFDHGFLIFFETGTKSPKAIQIYTVDTLRRWLRRKFS